MDQSQGLSGGFLSAVAKHMYTSSYIKGSLILLTHFVVVALNETKNDKVVPL